MMCVFLASSSFLWCFLYVCLVWGGCCLGVLFVCYGSFLCASSQKSPSNSSVPLGSCLWRRQNFEASCVGQVRDCPGRDGSGPAVWNSWHPGVWLRCRCLFSEALFKIQGIFVCLVIRSWISFVVAFATDHSEGGEFYCGETNPRALLLVSRFFPPARIQRCMKPIRQKRAVICFSCWLFSPTPVPSKTS